VRGRQIFAVAASVAALALAAGAVGYLLGEHGPTSAVSPGNGSNGFNFTFPGFGGNSNGQSSSTVPKAVQTSEKALVDINTTIDSSQATGAGTGIVLTSSGLVLTNNHVIDGASTISVTDLGNNQTYSATVVGYDVKRDVAVLQLTGASGLATASIGAAATTGQTVYAVGNAGGTGGTPTVTSGTITGTGKSVTASDAFDGTAEELHGMLQTSAALISGDSGGALMSASGQVVGMDTAGSSGSGPVGGYAIPIATALSIAHEIEAGTATPNIHIGATALLGVQIRPGAQTTGAPVVAVVPGTPAAAAGITPGSRVTSVGGISIPNSAALRLAMTRLAVGSSVKITWVDAKGVAHSATVTLTGGSPQ
jgi:S1-C subfamily serine protease